MKTIKEILKRDRAAEASDYPKLYLVADRQIGPHVLNSVT